MAAHRTSRAVSAITPTAGGQSEFPAAAAGNPMHDRRSDRGNCAIKINGLELQADYWPEMGGSAGMRLSNPVGKRLGWQAGDAGLRDQILGPVASNRPVLLS
jgi:hypothetical protein